MDQRAHIDVVNMQINPTFSNTNNFDVVIFTDTNTQSIHLGSMSLSNSTVKISNQDVRMEADIVIRKQLQASCNDSLGLPGISWHTNSNTGLYRMAPNKIGVSAGGSHVMGLSNGGVNITGNLNVDGIFTYQGTLVQTGTPGISNVDNRNITIASGCNMRMIHGQILGASNDSTSPTYSWSNDSNTGMYHYVQSSLGFKASNVHVVEVSKSGINVLGDINFSGALRRQGADFHIGTPGLSNIGNDVRVLANSNLVIQDGQILAWSNDIVTKPAYSWSNNSNTGMYHISNNVIGFASGGAHVISLSNGVLDLVGDINFSGALRRQGINFQSGTPGLSNSASEVRVLANSNLVIQSGQILGWSNDIATKPAYSWSNNSNTGMYHVSNNVIGFASGGIHVMSLSNGGLDLVGDINFSGAVRRQGVDFQATPGLGNLDNEVRVLANSNLVIQGGQILGWPNDFVTKPAYSWSNNSNTGMYHITNNVIGFSSGGIHVMSLSNGGLDLIGDINFSGTLRRQGAADFQKGLPGLSNLDKDVGVLSDSNIVIEKGQILGRLNDNVTNPAYSWSNNSNTGIYKVSNNVIGFSANGQQVLALEEYSAIAKKNIVPSKNEACDLGMASQRWRDIYVSALMLGDSQIVNDSGIISATTYGVFEPIANRLIDVPLGKASFSYSDKTPLYTLAIPRGDGNMLVLPPSYNLLSTDNSWTIEFFVGCQNFSARKQTVFAYQAPLSDFCSLGFYIGSDSFGRIEYFNGSQQVTTAVNINTVGNRVRIAITYSSANTNIGLTVVNESQINVNSDYRVTRIESFNLPLTFGNTRDFTSFLSVKPSGWYDANSLSPLTTYVAILHDLSGNNKSMVQSTNTKQPSYSLLVNQMPSIKLSSGNQMITFSCLGASVTEFTIAIVLDSGNIKYNDIYTIFSTIAPWPSNGFALKVANSSLWAHLGNEKTNIASILPNTQYILIYTFKDGKGQLHLNGITLTLSSFAQTIINITSTQIGEHNSLAEWNARYCELLVFGSQLSIIDIRKLETYLASKWWLASTNPLPLTHPYKAISLQKTLKVTKDWYKVIVEVADAINNPIIPDSSEIMYIWNVRFTKGVRLYQDEYASIQRPVWNTQISAATVGTTTLLGWQANKTIKKTLDIDRLSTNTFRSPYIFSYSIYINNTIEDNATFTFNILSLQGYDTNFAPGTLVSCCPQGSGILTICPYFSSEPAYSNKYVCHLSYSNNQTTKGQSTYTYTTNTIASNMLTATQLLSSTTSQLTLTNSTGSTIIGYIATFVNTVPYVTIDTSQILLPQLIGFPSATATINTISISFTIGENCDYVRIEYVADGSTIPTAIDGVTASPYTITGLPITTTYSYKVIPGNNVSGYNTAYSTLYTITTLRPGPAPDIELSFGASVPSKDDSGTKTLTINGTPSIFNDPTRGYVLNLNGSSSIKINSYTLPISYTKMAWVNIQELNNSFQHIISSATITGTGPFHYLYWNSSITPQVLTYGHEIAGTSFASSDASSLPARTWRHICVTYDSSTKTFKTYHDLFLKKTDTFQNDTWVGEGDVMIGASGNMNYWIGYIDDVKIYNTALTLSQIRDIVVPLTPDINVNFTSSMIIISNSSSSSTSTVSSIIVNDAVRGYVANLGGSSYFRVNSYYTLPKSYTKMAWVYLPSSYTGANASIISSATSTGAVHNLYILGSKIYSSHDGDGNTSITLADTTSISTSSWVHVCVTYDHTTKTLTLYRNTVQVAQSISFTPTVAWSGGGGVMIGAFAGNNIWPGYIDDVKIFSTALSAFQVSFFSKI